MCYRAVQLDKVIANNITSYLSRPKKKVMQGKLGIIFITVISSTNIFYKDLTNDSQKSSYTLL